MASRRATRLRLSQRRFAVEGSGASVCWARSRVGGDGTLISAATSSTTITGTGITRQSEGGCSPVSRGASCEAANPFTPGAPGIRLSVTVSPDGVVHVSGSSYPSVEVWAYYADGSASLILYNAENLFGAGIGLWPVFDWSRDVITE